VIECAKTSFSLKNIVFSIIIQSLIIIGINLFMISSMIKSL